MKGAEAVLTKTVLIGRNCLTKTRIVKGYRISALDTRLRAERTRMEARLLNKAKIAEVPCPTVLEVGEFEITMERIDGERPEMRPQECFDAGALLAKLHEADIIHGDYTPANLIADKRTSHLTVIDFGLGCISNDIEDKAVDVFTMFRSLADDEGKGSFLSGYGKYSKAESVLKRLKIVEKRVRYAF
jgi:N6-L-threonylcarbamoyladenine synthase/protein kinase Bud32